MAGRPLFHPLFPDRPWLTDFLALVAGLLMPLALAPFNLWWSSTIGLLLLLSVIQAAPNRRALWRWYLFGLGHYVFAASWIYVSINTHGGASPLLAGLLVFLFAAGLSLLFLLNGLALQFVTPADSKPLGSWFALLGAFPALWLFREWTTTWLLTGFPWALSGYGHLVTPLSGWAPVVGVLGVGYLSTLLAALVFAGLTSRGRTRWLLLFVASLPALTGFALSRVSFTQADGPAVSVSLVQGNIAQETKWRRSSVQPILNRYTELTASEWGRDILVWPEAAVTLFHDSAEPFLAALDQRGQNAGSALLLGMPSRDEQSYFNSAVVVGDGSGFYQKRHLVPFGEYVPLESVLRGVIKFFDLPMSRNRPGPDEQVALILRGLPVTLSICYEVVFPDLVRQGAADSALLITISNDTWFGRSIGPHQHLQMAQMRALENGRYLIRATNNGLTAVIDPGGRVVKQLPQFEPAVLRGQVTPYAGATPYTMAGDMPLLLGLGLLLLIHRFRTGSGIVPVRRSDPSNGE